MCQQGCWSQKGVIGRSPIHWRRERVPARTLGLKKGWIVRSHVGWRRKQSIIYKSVETSPKQTRFKNLEKSSKRGIGLLQDGSDTVIGVGWEGLKC